MSQRRTGRKYRQDKKPVCMVAIEQRGDHYRYLRYANGKLTDKAESPDPISAAHVELLRTDPAAILGDDTPEQPA